MLVAAVVATTAVGELLRLVGCTAAQYAQAGTLMFRVPSPGVQEPARLIELGPIVAQGTGPIAVMVMERIAELRGAQRLSELQQQALLITAEAVATMRTATGSARATILTDCGIGSEFLHRAGGRYRPRDPRFRSSSGSSPRPRRAPCPPAALAQPRSSSIAQAAMRAPGDNFLAVCGKRRSVRLGQSATPDNASRQHAELSSRGPRPDRRHET
jgi:hypothetical protein